MILLLYSREESPYHVIGDIVGSRAGLEALEERKIPHVYFLRF